MPQKDGAVDFLPSKISILIDNNNSKLPTQQNDSLWLSVERHQSTISASSGELKKLNVRETDGMK